MFKKIGIILFFAAIVGARHAVPLQGLAFAAVTDDTLCLQCPAEEYLTIETWYPSPYNEYEELRLYPISESNSPNGECGQDNRGLMYYDKDDDKVYICKGAILGWKELGASGSLTQSNTSISSCDSTNLGTLVYDTTQKRPYVCAQNASNGYVWKPLDSDNDRDGITDAVDANDNDFNDATAVEANVETGKTFYARGGPRRTGTLVSSDVGGVCIDSKIYWTQNSPITCANGEWHAWAEGHLCEGVIGNAFCDTGSACGGGGINGYSWWWWAGNPCKCPVGYTLTEFMSYDPEGSSNWSREYYCKRN